jgi:adenylate cyclase, class 2
MTVKTGLATNLSGAGNLCRSVLVAHPISMPRETEIKLFPKDLKAFLRNLKRLGGTYASPKLPCVHESNLLFDTPQGGLAKHGQLLRIRTEIAAPANKKPSPKSPQRHILTFKSPPESLAMGAQSSDFLPETYSASGRRHKVREETELVITDAAALQKIFEGLGLRGWFRYEKYRTTYKLPARLKWAQGLLIEIDRTPIGTYVELEGPGAAIDRAANELGFAQSDFILKNYLVLYLEDCKKRGVQPTHMLFAPA